MKKLSAELKKQIVNGQKLDEEIRENLTRLGFGF